MWEWIYKLGKCTIVFLLAYFPSVQQSAAKIETASLLWNRQYLFCLLFGLYFVSWRWEQQSLVQPSKSRRGPSPALETTQSGPRKGVSRGGREQEWGGLQGVGHLHCMQRDHWEGQDHRGGGSLFTDTRRNCTEFTAAQQLIIWLKPNQRGRTCPTEAEGSRL